MDLKPQTHTVKKKGETLIAIAKQYGFTDWKIIWNDKLNDALRRTRKKPEAIDIGDKIMIPPNPADVKAAEDERRRIEGVIARLRQLRTDTEKDFGAMEAALDKDFKKIKDLGDNLDLAAMVLTAVVSTAAEGAKIVKASKTVGQSVAKETLKGVIITGGLEIVVGIAEPSWWAEKITKWITGEDNETAYKNAVNLLLKTKQQALENLAIKIHDYENALKKAGG